MNERIWFYIGYLFYVIFGIYNLVNFLGLKYIHVSKIKNVTRRSSGSRIFYFLSRYKGEKSSVDVILQTLDLYWY